MKENFPEEIDRDLLIKYSKPGPRYTSYPTAPVWTDQVTNFTYKDHLESLASSSNEASLYCHLPFCPSHCYFCGCNVIITTKRGPISSYISYLLKELTLLAPYLKNKKIKQLQWGGGSPSHLTEAEIRSLMDHIKANFTFADEPEIGIEINPEQVGESFIQVLKEVGFNRISMGIQDFDEKVQKEINRVQAYEDIEKTVSYIKSHSEVKSLNMDLIYGLPHQTRAGFKTTLDLVLSLDPDRLAIYNYAHVPWIKPAQRRFDEATLPSGIEKMEAFLDTVHYLDSKGYEFIGLDHFAKKDDCLSKAYQDRTMHRNFMGYTTHKGLDLFAAGVTSIGYSSAGFFQNHKKLTTYQEMIDNGMFPIEKGFLLSNEDLLRQDIIMRLMNQEGFVFSSLENEYDIDFKEKFQEELLELKPFVEDGFITLNDEEIRVTPLGRFFIRNVCLPFDEYFKEQQKQKNLFSKTL
ncbi:oxygen-independent coproporphyrinogen III oxidase [bacterium]|nr:oxygen-independent coproporphyrinogen III oxidase [bacterium]